MTRTLLLAIALLFTLALPVAAHEEGAIHLASDEVTLGGALTLEGEHLPENATLRLELQGALETFALGEIRTDSAGTYHGSVQLPATGQPGAYSVVAIAADGDVVARADLVILAAAASEPAQPDAAGAVTEPESPVATAALMDLPVDRNPVEWAGILAFVILALVGGTALLRSAARG